MRPLLVIFRTTIPLRGCSPRVAGLNTPSWTRVFPRNKIALPRSARLPFGKVCEQRGNQSSPPLPDPGHPHCPYISTTHTAPPPPSLAAPPSCRGSQRGWKLPNVGAPFLLGSAIQANVRWTCFLLDHTMDMDGSHLAFQC